MDQTNIEGSDGGPLPGSKRQFVTCKVNASDTRTYTYHNDSAPLAPGDKVRVETNRGEANVEVVSIDLPEPPFATKPILGRADAALV